MTTPTQVSAQNVNYEIAATSNTTQLSWGNNWARNVATAFTGTNSTVNAAEFRWGINFPGGYFTSAGRTNFYNLNDYMSLVGYNTVMVFPPVGGSASSSASLTLFANGQMRVICDGTTAFNTTWRTSGASSDYAVIMEMISGVFDSGGAVGDVTYNLGSDRTYSLSVTSPPTGTTILNTSQSKYIDAVMTIKNNSSGVTLFTRPFSISVTAETSTNQ